MEDPPRVEDAPPPWEHVAVVLRQLARRDSPWAAEWQIEESVDRIRGHFESLDVEGRARYLATTKTDLDLTNEERFSAWLRSELDQRGWSQSELARAIDVNPSAVSKWLSARQRPAPDQCERIAKAFGRGVGLVMREAGHGVYAREYGVDGWLVESEVRNEIVNIIQDIPETLLLPVIPMLRALAAKDTADEVFQRMGKTVSRDSPVFLNVEGLSHGQSSEGGPPPSNPESG